MDIRGKKLLVIGGAGLIGSHIVDELTKEDVGEIVIYDNFARGTHDNIKSALRDPRVKIFDLGGDICHTDILDEAVKNADGVFHLAALWLLHCHDYPESAFKVNVEGTFNVMQACVKHKVKRLVYSSSASVYGNAVETPMTEEHPFNNTNFYGATKIAAEAMLRSYHHRYGLNYTGLRYMNVYGPRQDYKGVYITVIMKMLDALERGEAPKVYGDGSQSYDFVYTTDVASANILAMKSKISDKFYNVGTGTQTSIKELAEMVLKITGSKKKIEYLPEGTTFVHTRVGCPKLAKKDLGFEAKTPLYDGLKNLIDWYNENKKI